MERKGAKEDDSDGVERVITDYSTNGKDVLQSSPYSQTSTWDDSPSASTTTGTATGSVKEPSTDANEAKAKIVGFINILLTRTPFDPSDVSLESLECMKGTFMVGCGEAMEMALSECEIEAIGQDGNNGDNVEEGGGRFREVQKVSAFLKGYREAEVGRGGREVVKRLLASVQGGGVKGLEEEFEKMGVEGLLDDDLIRYLGRTVDEQERVVEGRGGDEGSKALLDVLRKVLERVKVEVRGADERAKKRPSDNVADGNKSRKSSRTPVRDALTT